VNRGSVALYSVEIRKKGIGSVSTVKSFEEGSAVLTGETAMVTLPSGINTNDDIVVIPVILGETATFKKAYVCDEDFGLELTVV
jgi:hypothetical protein